jgi:Na+/H+-dicarboxylate symporter
MIPVLVSIFHFNPAMVSIITTLYFLLDSFGTAANVMGDGALVMVVHRMVRRFV